MALGTFSWLPDELTMQQHIARYFCLVLESIWICSQGLIVYSIWRHKIRFDYELTINCIILFFDFLFCLTVFVWSIYTAVEGQSKLTCQIQGTITLFTLSMFIFGTSLLSSYRHVKVKQFKKIPDICFVLIFIPVTILLGILYIWAATNNWYTVTASSYCMLSPLEGTSPRVLFGLAIVMGIVCVLATIFNYSSIMHFSFSFISHYNFDQDAMQSTSNFNSAIKARNVSRSMMMFRGSCVILLYLMTIVPQLLTCLYSIITLEIAPVWLQLYASSSVSVYCGVNLACMLALNAQVRKAIKKCILYENVY
ncbi:hypothetical protein CONCODRAFT_7287 [Conidiobolus coronatus NRRL 28638]|uniref:G-protein coupled receptors family 1 profile domain-containing protein n=1 Tax=Conidiobolus coronatus (strain ATCC 28846 / CBS 209.66 / NRRL 28638) TaxID=796925 RepID=A0A137P5K0_CONC2|nr:hypothetical protein CONCODRAFT_7287 [Conidiobolus coronatus NRRL 28638]|eukprot:KXN70201.1 hypothetical protein CONCODRAFT_7287 [Conidiobolus coronatus NRRL 28638]